MEQVVLNLAVNARDAMPQGGELVIETSDVEVNEARAQSHPKARPGSHVWLRVADTGCGMDSNTLQHLFEPFFTTKGVGKGTGLGLATVYGIIEQHRGWIEVESAPGHGTTFRIFLPVAEGQIAAARPAAQSPDDAKGGQETILLVEDEELLRELARTTLEGLGYTVLEAPNATEAMKVWKQNPGVAKLLLTDMVMPGGVTGRELAEALRRDQADLAVVFSSGYSQETLDPVRQECPGTAFLQKPYRPDDLARVVRECLDHEAASPSGPARN